MTTTNLTATYLSIDANDVSDQLQDCTLTITKEALENTALDDTARTYTAGLEVCEVTASLFLSYGASEVEAILEGIVGTSVDVVVGKNSVTPAADNPVYTITGMYLAEFTPFNGGVGELSTVDITLTGGSYTRAVA